VTPNNGPLETANADAHHPLYRTRGADLAPSLCRSTNFVHFGAIESGPTPALNQMECGFEHSNIEKYINSTMQNFTLKLC
jgi:hypothetical protein